MNKAVINAFTQYALSESELSAGLILSHLQRQVIQNRIAEAALQKVRMTYNLENPTACLQQEAELQGRILTLQQILDDSDQAEAEVLEAAQEQ